MDSATLPTDIPRARMEMTRAPKSWTAPIKSVPRTTHNMAGTQPQMTAMAGPSIGDNPVQESEADAYIERQLKFDPDIWVLEIEDSDCRYEIDGEVI